MLLRKKAEIDRQQPFRRCSGYSFLIGPGQ